MGEGGFPIPSEHKTLFFCLQHCNAVPQSVHVLLGNIWPKRKSLQNKGLTNTTSQQVAPDKTAVETWLLPPSQILCTIFLEK